MFKLILTLVLLCGCGSSPSASDGSPTPDGSATPTPSVEASTAPAASEASTSSASDTPAPAPSTVQAGNIFVPASAPPALTGKETGVTISQPGQDYDFTGALAVSTVKQTSLATSESDFKKIDATGALLEIAKGSVKAMKIKRGKTRLLVLDSNGASTLVDTDGMETIVPALNFESARFNEEGTLFFTDNGSTIINSIVPSSKTPNKITNYPFDNMSLTKVSGNAVEYAATSNGIYNRFVLNNGIQFPATDSSYGLKVALGSGYLAINSFMYWDGTQAVSERTSFVSFNGFRHDDGAVVISAGIGISCDGYTLGFVNLKREITPIGCNPRGMMQEAFDGPIASGDLFVVKGTSEVWVYGVNTWQQKLLSGFTPINLSFAGTTLYYDGMTLQGEYVAGQMDVITKKNKPITTDTQLGNLVGLK